MFGFWCRTLTVNPQHSATASDSRLAAIMISTTMHLAFALALVGHTAGVPDLPPTMVPDSFVSRYNTVIVGEHWTFSVKLKWPLGNINETDIVYYAIGLPGAVPQDLGNFSVASMAGDDQIMKTTRDDLVTNGLRETVDFELEAPHTGAHDFQLWLSWNQDFQDASVAVLPEVTFITGGLTMIPVIITIIIVIWSRDVILSLFLGVYFAALLTSNYDPFTAFVRSLDTFVLGAISDRDHSTILLFTWFIAGMIACCIKAGGGGGMVMMFNKFARSPRSGSLLVASLSLLIFFDDYANTLIVGQTMRPVADTLQISREKLAFMVDGIAAPITSISPISSWIGFELSLIENALDNLDIGEDCYEDSPFLIFVQTIPYRFYPLYLLALQFALILSGREMGPMLVAERKARSGRLWTAESAMEDDEITLNPSSNESNVATGDAGILEKSWPHPKTPLRWWNGVIPIATVVGGVLLSLVLTGMHECDRIGKEKSIHNIFGESDSMRSLLYASAVGSIGTFLLISVQRVDSDHKLHLVGMSKKGTTTPLLSLKQMKEVWVEGMGNIMDATLTLILAWAIGDAFTECQTGTYISLALSNSIPPEYFPTITFALASVLSLVTGTSWGTMGILFPIVIPSAHLSAPCNGNIFYGTIAGILAGAVFGDHCSPISDTTLLASIACQCPLTSHVITQAPYAAVTGIVAVVLGTLPVGLGAYPAWAGILLGCTVVCIGVPFLGAKVESDDLDKFSMLTSGLRSCFRRCYWRLRRNSNR